MGGVFTCLEEVPDLQRLQYDMTPIKSNPVPIVWLVGPPGSGRTTQGQALSENLGFENIKISNLLKDEAEKETDRGRIIKDSMSNNQSKKLPDTLVVDLIKEAMLQKAPTAKGFVLNGFPRTNKQATLFVKEIGDVDVVVYLYSETQVLVTRTQEKRGGRVDPETIKRDIQNCIKEVKDSVSKFGAKMEKIHTDAPPGDVYGRIEAAINVRLNIKPSASFNDQLPMMQEL
ncbi:hypothetical protein ILUMI_21379 [Ignelater luminosus]|uniref:Adenylate kinase n=1 Tax=Ignelater luminosus TaxID=2038154 RepID=A0A8K0G1F6_IGNLU|nr:hypothetical protein ILUMI_21379 [Ignelater luminosus]